jgi:hypothetical protein
MSERGEGALVVEETSERGQEPSLATATGKGVPERSPARQGQERER